MKAYATFPEGLKSEVLKASMAMAPNGTAVQRSQGRELAHLVLVLSAMMPMMGLKNARHTSRRL